jgi:peptidoglycan glycosyltransferase
VTLPTPPEIFSALVNSAAWPALRVALHIAFFLCVLVILRQVLALARDGNRAKGQPVRRRGLPPLPLTGLALLFAAVLGYQASWQLAGVFRPEFVAFMQSHDRREFNPAHLIQRGRILDRTGKVLAYSQEHQGQVFRLYPYGPAFAHAVGYTHPRFGVTGAEAAANAHLNGGAPDNLAAWGELGRHLLTKNKRLRGQDLVLNLDTRLQLTALQGLGSRRGAVVVLRPRDGAILTLASTPAFDPNQIGPDLFQGENPGTPLLNRATQGFYPPGSTFKVLVAATAIETGFTGTLNCPPDGYTTSRRYPKIRDHEFYTGGRRWTGHGNLDLTTAFAESSNVFFAQLGVRQGHDALFAAGERFGFDRQVRLYPGADRAGNMSTGRIPRLAKSDLYGLAQASIGQGRVLATPAHMALIAAAVANGGLAMRPRLLADEPPAPLAGYMAPATSARLTKMMRKVVTSGTGKGIEVPDVAIAGKTGTAENPRGDAHSWFIGFAPAQDPELAVAVLVEHGGYGSSVAAPIARDLLVQARELGIIK